MWGGCCGPVPTTKGIKCWAIQCFRGKVEYTTVELGDCIVLQGHCSESRWALWPTGKGQFEGWKKGYD